jgi:FtsP/CotA-like multicopper oxidase with cupredoxin domain
MNHHDHARAARDTFPRDTEGLPGATPPETVDLRDGDMFALSICPVRKRVGDAEVRMLGYNGSIPGPPLRVDQGSEITVQVANEGDVETTVHWHGLRLENRYDGVPEDTQAPIEIGGTFAYKVRFPDAGLVCTGETVDILLRLTNPGIWMAHCHIAEHTEGGMMFSFEVGEARSGEGTGQ